MSSQSEQQTRDQLHKMYR